MTVRVLLIDDDFGRPDHAADVGDLFGAHRVCDAVEGNELWRAGIMPVTRSNRGMEALNRLDVYVSTGQVRTGGGRENSLRLVEQALKAGWPGRSANETWRWALAIVDLKFVSDPVRSEDPTFGHQIFGSVERICPEVRVALFTQYEDISTEEAAGRAGKERMAGLLPKSGIGELPERLRRMLVIHGLLPDLGGDLIGCSLPWMVLLQKAREHAARRMTLLMGPKGSGKEGIARYIHDWSARPGRFEQFSLSEGASDPQAVALFGSRRGAATHLPDAPGIFEVASRDTAGRETAGTVFLDEIHNCALETQGRLLEVLEHRADGKYYVARVGDHARRRIDPWVVAATNLSRRELYQRMGEGAFRDDLFDRLAGHQAIEIPSLGERADDVPLLVEYFVKKFDKQCARRIRQDTIERLIEFIRAAPPRSLTMRWLRDLINQAVSRYAEMRSLLPEHLDLKAASEFLTSAEAGNSSRPGEHAPIADTGPLVPASPSPRFALDVLANSTAKGVPFSELRETLGDLGRAVVRLSADIYIHARVSQANPELKAIVRQLTGETELNGTEVSDRFLKWALTWSDHGLDVPTWLKEEVARVYQARYRKPFPGWGNARRQERGS